MGIIKQASQGNLEKMFNVDKDSILEWGGK